MESFRELALPAFLHESLQKMKFEKPTDVQAQAIPPGLTGKDVIASAETGSGKTAAFGIPLLAFLDMNRNQTALILTPTRELAEQVKGVLDQLSGGRHDLRSVLLIGGMGMGAQVDALRRGTRLFIGTPGRINDHLEHRTLNLSRTGFLVLDEADRMLDMGFAPQLDRIRRWLTGPRQTQLFSATIPPDIQKMASLYLKDPVRVTVGTNARPVERIQQKVLRTSQGRKIDDLMEELKTRKGSVLVFVRTKHRVDRIAQKLKEKGFDAIRIHGDRTQGQRRTALDNFKSGAARVMVATDIAARGLDILTIAHVINFDLPMVPDDYVHRVGRTARAGAGGDSLTLLTPEDAELWRDILKHLGTAQSAITELPSHFTDHAPAPEHPGGHHPQGRRDSGRSHGGPHPGSSSHHRQGQGSHGPRHGSSSEGHRGAPGGSSHRPGEAGRSNENSGPSHGHRDVHAPASHEPGRHQPYRGNRESNRPGQNDPGRDRQNRGYHSGSGQGPSRGPGHEGNSARRNDRTGRSERRSGDSAASKVKRWFRRMF